MAANFTHSTGHSGVYLLLAWFIQVLCVLKSIQLELIVTYQDAILKFYSLCPKCHIFCFSFPSSVPHTRSLEARIKEELVAQGLLDSEERPGPGGDSEDEVLAELQKRQAELKALTAHNRARKQELLR